MIIITKTRSDGHICNTCKNKSVVEITLEDNHNNVISVCLCKDCAHSLKIMLESVIEHGELH